MVSLILSQLSALSSSLEQLIHTLRKDNEVQADKAGGSGDITAEVWSEVMNENEIVIKQVFIPQVESPHGK